MAEGKFRNRHRLSKKELKALQQQLISLTGFSPVSEDTSVDVAQTDKWTVILDGAEVIGIYIDDRPFPTIKGLLRSNPQIRYVTVDMGAVKFVASGADVMAPGIVDVDQNIKEGDAVWVRDVKNKKPIAIGIALRAGPKMISDKKGKAVKNIHYVGDEIWNIGKQ